MTLLRFLASFEFSLFFPSFSRRSRINQPPRARFPVIAPSASRPGTARRPCSSRSPAWQAQLHYPNTAPAAASRDPAYADAPQSDGSASGRSPLPQIVSPLNSPVFSPHLYFIRMYFSLNVTLLLFLAPFHFFSFLPHISWRSIIDQHKSARKLQLFSPIFLSSSSFCFPL